MASNYFFSALAGVTWYFQFFSTPWVKPKWADTNSPVGLHMASIIIFIFSSLWGIGLKEWKGSGVQAGCRLALALFLLVGSTVIIGYGNYLGITR